MQKLAAIILSSYDIGEFDRIYTMYTRELGLARVIGRGVRKPTAKLAGHLEPGTHSEVYVARSKGMGRITSAITLQNFEKAKENFGTLNEILKIFRFFTKNFSEGEIDEKVFDLLKNILEILSKAKKHRPETDNLEKISVEAFWWQMFDLMGHRPEVTRCLMCSALLNAQEKNFFVLTKGGIVCEKCLGGESGLSRITPNQIKLLRIFLANPLEKIIKVKVNEAELNGLGRIRGEFEKYNF